jgi:hypothetical protein
VAGLRAASNQTAARMDLSIRRQPISRDRYASRRVQAAPALGRFCLLYGGTSLRLGPLPSAQPDPVPLCRSCNVALSSADDIQADLPELADHVCQRVCGGA